MRTKLPLFVSLLLLGLTEQSGFARTTVLVTGIQSNGTASDRAEQAIAARIKRLGDTEDHSQQQRPPVTGGDGQVVAEF